MRRLSFLVPCALFTFAAAGCSSADRTPLDRGPTPGASAGAGTFVNAPTVEGEKPPVDPASCGQNVDIVFVMDVSTSMDVFLNKLAQEIVGVDTSIKGISSNISPYYGLAVFVDDTKMLNNGKPFQNVDALRAEFQKWANFSSSNQQLEAAETNMTWPENSIDALHEAATSFSWRPGSLRIAIHTTDDTFWEGPRSENGVAIQHGYLETVQKLRDQQVRVFSFASKLGGQSENLDVSMGWFSPYKGQDPIPNATYGGAFELGQVLNGQTSLSSSIYGLVKDTLCKPYPKIN